MFGRTSLLKATALALPFSLAAVGAEAASVADAVLQNQQLSTFAKAIDAAQLGQQLSGPGPYTVFAPTDQAFERLPQGALDELMKQENRAQLTKLLEHHVVQGQAIAAEDVLGGQIQVDTMSGDTLTLDGTSQAVLLVPTGLTIAQVGDQLVVQREGVVVSTRAIRVEDQVVRQAGAEQQQGQAQQAQQHGQAQRAQAQQMEETPVAQGSDMPVSQHQEQVLRDAPAEEQRQTAPEDAALPATEHQQQVLAGGEQGGAQQQAQGQQAQGQQPEAQQQAQAQQPPQAQQQAPQTAETPVAEGSDMPMTEHQQEMLANEPGQEQQQTAPEGAAPMPATEHQRQVLAGQELPGEQQQSEQAPVQGQPDILREAMVVEAGIQADNGVIHVIDAVLVPQEVLKMLETAKQSQG